MHFGTLLFYSRMLICQFRLSLMERRFRLLDVSSCPPTLPDRNIHRTSYGKNAVIVRWIGAKHAVIAIHDTDGKRSACAAESACSAAFTCASAD